MRDHDHSSTFGGNSSFNFPTRIQALVCSAESLLTPLEQAPAGPWSDGISRTAGTCADQIRSQADEHLVSCTCLSQYWSWLWPVLLVSTITACREKAMCSCHRSCPSTLLDGVKHYLRPDLVRQRPRSPQPVALRRTPARSRMQKQEQLVRAAASPSALLLSSTIQEYLECGLIRCTLERATHTAETGDLCGMVSLDP